MPKRYIYEVSKDGKKIFEGTTDELKKRFYVSSISTLKREYSITKKPYKFNPKHKQKYYYYSTLTETAQYDYWDINDTNCLMRWNSKNVYKTSTLASKYGCESMNNIRKEYIEQCSNY